RNASSRRTRPAGWAGGPPGRSSWERGMAVEGSFRPPVVNVGIGIPIVSFGWGKIDSVPRNRQNAFVLAATHIARGASIPIPELQRLQSPLQLGRGQRHGILLQAVGDRHVF